MLIWMHIVIYVLLKMWNNVWLMRMRLSNCTIMRSSRLRLSYCYQGLDT
ncbi:hypothetical protein Pint_17829 [Pistacia integerrima]|uniref:Uncharacterized protein n=1 Tax=Pistacia integerrima TaxID=434235 RepID=A0ACC0YX26_9ROSI|nr:hypothetical protein Pint_17829 [Pistacia integerrima]